MSAWIVSREHIDAMVTALRPETQAEGDRLGRVLWGENLRSVAYRYPDDGSGQRPGPGAVDPATNQFVGVGDDEIESYTWTSTEVPDLWLLAAAHCLSYQSCEHPEWEESEAFAICAKIEAELDPVFGETYSRDYRRPCAPDNAPWGIDAKALDELFVTTP